MSFVYRYKNPILMYAHFTNCNDDNYFSCLNNFPVRER